MRRSAPLARKTPLSRTAGKHRARRDTGPDRATRALVLRRDAWSCVRCGMPVTGRRYSLQHRKRRSQGGTNDPRNLITVCGDGTTGCHERIDSRRDPADEAAGYTVRSWDDPALVPVMIPVPGAGRVAAWATGDGRWVFEAPGGAGAP